MKIASKVHKYNLKTDVDKENKMIFKKRNARFYFYFSLLQFIMMTAYSEEKKGLLANFYFYFYSYLVHLFLGESAR
jgi:hypothetical protein